MSEENGIHLITDPNVRPDRSIEPAGIEQAQSQSGASSSIKVTVECDIDLVLLRKQKRALVGLREGVVATYEQENAAEGLLNLLDFIQDSILEQGLATEDDIFPRLPQLFGPESSNFEALA